MLSTTGNEMCDLILIYRVNGLLKPNGMYLVLRVSNVKFEDYVKVGP